MPNVPISIFQTNPKWGDAKNNLTKVEEMMNGLSLKSDFIVLPEMFNTAYVMQPEEFAEPLDGFTIQKLTELSALHDCTFIGSIPTIRDAKYNNTCIVVDKNGLQYTYNKIHLYTPAGEGEEYTAGSSSHIFTTENGIKIKPLVCYDLRFPYLSFNNDEEKYDILIYSANWPSPRINQWKSLLIARAIENQCYVIGVNRVGHDSNGFEYPGQSMVVNYMGEILAELDDKDQVKTLELEMDEMMEYREKYPFLKDGINND